MTAQVIGVPQEVFPGEKRVATVPEVVPKLIHAVDDAAMVTLVPVPSTGAGLDS